MKSIHIEDNEWTTKVFMEERDGSYINMEKFGVLPDIFNVQYTYYGQYSVRILTINLQTSVQVMYESSQSRKSFLMLQRKDCV